MPLESTDLKRHWNNVWSSSYYASHRKRLERSQNKLNVLFDKGELKIYKGMKVLDAGCGDGSTLSLLRKQFDVESFGIDISDKALEKALLLSKQENLNIEFKKADVRSVPYPSNYFDLILSWGVIEHFDNYELAIDEFYRTLKPGGVLNLIQPNKLSFAPLQRIWLEITGKWESGPQIEFTGRFLKNMLLKKKFKDICYFSEPPFIDFKFTYYIDSVFNSFWKDWGHYLYILGTKKVSSGIDRTILLIKPDAFEENLIEDILSMVNSLDRVVILKKEIFRPDRKDIEFHHSKSFFSSVKETALREKIIDYWLSGPMIKVLIEGENVIDRIHDLVGLTDPSQSSKVTIRHLSDDSIESAEKENRAVRNLAHAPRSKEEAQRDISIWFKDLVI